MEHTYLVKKSSACSGRPLRNRIARQQDARPESLMDYFFIEILHLELEVEFEAEALHHIRRKYVAPGLEIPNLPTILTTLQRAHYTELLARHRRQWEKCLQPKHTTVWKNMLSTSWKWKFLLKNSCLAHRTAVVCLSLFWKRKKWWSTENRAENQPLHCLKRRGEMRREQVTLS